VGVVVVSVGDDGLEPQEKRARGRNTSRNGMIKSIYFFMIQDLCSMPIFNWEMEMARHYRLSVMIMLLAVMAGWC
jgi:hypothetical protein